MGAPGVNKSRPPRGDRNGLAGAFHSNSGCCYRRGRVNPGSGANAGGAAVGWRGELVPLHRGFDWLLVV